ncbi:hypothetical protein ACHAXR_004008, partial [Thalassiosira sp. AJA248-18]
IEQTDGFSGEAAVASKMEKLASGGDDIASSFGGDDDDDRTMSKNALARRKRLPSSSSNGAEQQQTNIAPKSPRPSAGQPRARTFRTATTRQPRRRRSKPPEQHLVPHFNGFTFKHQSDSDWLGLSGNDGKMKPKMHLGEPPSPVDEKDRLRAETPMFEDVYRPNRKKDVVYFNSNSYLGQQYLSPDAIRAGYTLGNDRPSPGESIVEFTEKQIFERDPDQLILQAESRLLHALAKFPQARAAMRTVYSTSTFGPSNMRWTSEEREWLFLCLTGSPEIDPPLPVELLDGGAPSQLHPFLAHRQDCPDNAFNRDAFEPATNHATDDIIEAIAESSIDSSPEYNISNSGDVSGTSSDGTAEVEVIGSEEEEFDSSHHPSSEVDTEANVGARNGHKNGLLDEYFLQTDMFPSFTNSKIAQETRAELTVQETVASLLRASAMKRFLSAKSKLSKIVSEMDRRDGDEEGNPPTADNDFDDVSPDELQELFRKVGNEVVDAQKSLYESERSTDRVNSHLLDYSVSNGVQDKITQSDLQRLDKMMEDHIASLPEDHHRPDRPGSDGVYEFGSDEFDGEIDPMFGGRNPDEFVVRGMPNGDSSWRQ